MSEVFNLQKNQIFNLEKEDTLLNYLILGMGWDNKPGQTTDMDLSAILMSNIGTVLEIVSFQNAGRWLANESIYHLGDDRTGNDSKTVTDNEQIQIRLKDMHSDVHCIFIVGSLFAGSMRNIENCYVCVRLTTDGPEVIKAPMIGGETGMILGSIKRHDNTWRIQNINHPCRGQVARDFIDTCRSLLETNRGGILSELNFTPRHPIRRIPVSTPRPIRGATLWERILAFLGIRS